jgi:hypothetical protein
MTYVDGNTLAGPLTEIFAADPTVAMTVCAECRRAERIAGLHVYSGGPGMVARCPSCAAVMLRYAETPHGRWLDLRGIATLRF